MSGSKGHSKASVALTRWLSESGTSQAELAAMITQELTRLGSPPAKPINQSTVSSWARGANRPRGLAMIALQAVAGTAATDWAAPPPAESGTSLPDVDRTGS